MGQLGPDTSAQAHEARQLFPPSLANPIPNLHSATVTSDEPFRLSVETRGAVMVNFLRELRARNIFLHSISHHVLTLMLESVDSRELQQHRLICKISLGYLCQETGRNPNSRGAKGHLSRAVQELLRMGIAKRLSIGNGAGASSYELQVPDEARHRFKSFPVKRKKSGQKEDGCARDDVERAPVMTWSARRRCPNKTIARASADVERAPALTSHVITGATIGEDTTDYPDDDDQTSSGTRRDVVWRVMIDELEKLQDLSEEKKNELLAAVKDPLFLLAAVLSSRQGHVRTAEGWVIGACNGTVKVGQRFFDQARRLVRKTIQSETPTASPEAAMADHVKVQKLAQDVQFSPLAITNPRVLEELAIVEEQNREIQILSELPLDVIRSLADRVIDAVPADNKFLELRYRKLRDTPWKSPAFRSEVFQLHQADQAKKEAGANATK